MRLSLTFSLLAVLLLVGAAPAGAATVVTGPAEAVDRVSATLTGTVDPAGASVTHFFEYGTSTDYGRETPRLPASGTQALPARAPIDDLEPGTTYHFRLVAGSVRGADRTFTTAAAGAPTVTQAALAERTPDSARFTARVDPRGEAADFWVEWGHSRDLGQQTAEQSLAAGAPRTVTVSLAQLPVRRRVYWRFAARGSGETGRSRIRAFVTLRRPTSVSLELLPRVAVWGNFVGARGTVAGEGVAGIPVALEVESFPFATGFVRAGTAAAGADGRFTFAALPVLAATRFRVSTRSAVVATSPAAQALVRPAIELARTQSRRRARLTGTVSPWLPAGRATLERRVGSRRWKPVAASAPLALVDAGRSSFAFGVRRARTARRYRVAIAPGDGGALVSAVSRSVRVGKVVRPKKRPRRP